MAQIEMVITEPAVLTAIVTADAVDGARDQARQPHRRGHQVDVGHGRALMRPRVALVASLAALSSPLRRRAGEHTARQARQRHHGLRGRVADRRLPEDRLRPEVLVRALEHARGADHARRAGRRVRLREHDDPRRSSLRRASCRSRSSSRATGSCSSSRPRTRPASTASTTCRKSGIKLVIAASGGPGRELHAAGAEADGPDERALERRQPRVRRAQRPLEGRARRGRRRLRLLDRREDRAGQGDGDQGSRLGAAEGDVLDGGRLGEHATRRRRSGSSTRC